MKKLACAEGKRRLTKTLDKRSSVFYNGYIPNECFKGASPIMRNKYPEITVEKILNVAQRLFLEKGYDNTTIQDIVDHLDGFIQGRGLPPF